MTTKKKPAVRKKRITKKELNISRHKKVVHIWRALRAGFALTGIVIWLLQDGFQPLDAVILGLAGMSAFLDQAFGLVCRVIEKVLGWKLSFSVGD